MILIVKSTRPLGCLRFICAHSVVSDSLHPWAAARQAPLSMGILRARVLE